MSLYQIQKLIQTVNRDEKLRDKFLESKNKLIKEFDLTIEEREALLELNIQALYKMGVHPLLLRPFTIIHGVSEPDYLNAIREEGQT